MKSTLPSWRMAEANAEELIANLQFEDFEHLNRGSVWLRVTEKEVLNTGGKWNIPLLQKVRVFVDFLLRYLQNRLVNSYLPVER